MNRFAEFVAIDWSGAQGERHKGIAVARCGAEGPPALIRREGGWSRPAVLDFLRRELTDASLVGLDLGTSLPFVDCGAYFPGIGNGPQTAPDLWAVVDEICTGDGHLAAGSFVDHPRYAPYFRRHGGREGAMFRCDDAPHGRGRFRVTEDAQARQGCKPYSNFNLVGAAQVGKSSLTGMRMLHRLRGHLPVWPVDPLPATGSAIVEIYTSLAAIEAGRTASRSKMRSVEELNAALEILGSPRASGNGAIDDHASDAMLTAAWLRAVADEPRRWNPAGLTAQIARTEGWTFGAV